MLIKWLTNRWLKQCAHLYIYSGEENIPNLVIDGSLVRFPLNLFNQIMQISHSFFIISDVGPEIGSGFAIF